MYSHEVAQTMPTAVIRHWREESKSSGLVSVTELAHSIAIIGGVMPETETDLVMPSMFDIVAAERDRTDADERVGDIGGETQYEDLDEFVRAGVERWQKLLQGISGVVGVELHFAEQLMPAETQMPSGLVVPHFEAPEFKAYAASPSEIEALNSMVNRIVLPAKDLDKVSTGVYL